MGRTTGKNPLRIAVSSGKGGVGKTSLSVNLAASLASHGKNVLLVDGDLGLANIDVVLGLALQRTMRDAVDSNADLSGVAVTVIPGLTVLPASSGVPEMANLPLEAQSLLIKKLDAMAADYDYIMIDTAAGLGESVLWFNNWAQENIVIFSPDPTSMTDAYALIKVLNTRQNKTRFHLVANSVQSQKQGLAIFDKMGAVLDRFLGIRPLSLGILPHDRAVADGIRRQKPFVVSEPQSRAARSVGKMADTIINTF